jgi:hypothetical protein
MKLCPSCDRHLFGPEPACPFCGAEQATTAARQSGGLASLTLAFALGTAACGPVVDPGQTDGSNPSSTGDETTIPPGTTAPPPSTTGVTTGDPDTDAPTTTTIEGTSTNDDGDSSCAFYAGCPPDIDKNPFECDVFAQDCPEGEKCMPWANDGGPSWNATRCSPVAENPGQPDEPCTVEGSGTSGIDSCDVGVMCWHVDPRTNEGTCVAMCIGNAGDPQCAAPEEACVSGAEGLIALCYDTCHPLDPMCPAGSACQPAPVGQPVLVCVPTSGKDVPHGEPCDFVTSCAEGLTCLDSSLFPACAGVSCCAEFCDLTAGVPCPDADQGVECVPWYEDGEAPSGHENLGVCVLPP